MNKTITIHSDFFEQFALDVACDLLNRRLILEDDTNFDEAIEVIIRRLKHQLYINENPSEFEDSISKERMDIAKYERS